MLDSEGAGIPIAKSSKIGLVATYPVLVPSAIAGGCLTRKEQYLARGVLCPQLDRKINPGNARHRDVGNGPDRELSAGMRSRPRAGR
jgi:hypothetical protein